MKNTDIIKCLKANKDVTDYQLVTSTKDSRELFYVLDHLEINRAVKTTTTAISVYVSDKETTGSSMVTVTSSDDEKSLNKKIKDAVKKAKRARNPYYPLPEKQESIKEKVKREDLNALANKVARAVFAADTYKDGWLNSTEIFVSSVSRKFFDSKGTRHESGGLSVAVEVIPTWSNNGEEIELYKFYESSVVDPKEITREIDELLRNAKDRSVAKTPKEVKIPKDVKVLVKDEMLDLILRTIVNDVSYSSIYFKQNHYQTGDVISANKFSLTLKPKEKGCARSAAYDGDGVVLKNTKIISDGQIKKEHGSNRFAYYLKKKATGSLPVMVLNGEKSEYKNEKHLIIENFSAPQMEDNTGYWGGEVRLARYFDGERYIPLTGFSISGNIYEDLKKLQLSKENDTLPDYKGPKYLIFDGIKIH